MGTGAETELALRLLAIDPLGLGGAVLRGDPALHAKHVDFLRALLPRTAVFRKLPSHAESDRITGGLDIAASLATGRQVFASGVLAAADGGFVVITSAERLKPEKAALIAMAMDDRAIHAKHDGLDVQVPARFCVLALDEGREDDEHVPRLLTERLAFHLVATDFDASASDAESGDTASVEIPANLVQLLCETALALGIASPRAALFAVRACRALALLDGKTIADEEHAAMAARLVLAPRATMIPASAEAETPPEQSDDGAPGTDENQVTKDDGDPLEVMLEAVLPALPPHLLEQLEAGANATRAGSGAASKKAGLRRGRPVGSRPGQPGGKARLHLIDTLRAAAPWQKIRRPDGSKGVQVRRDDFRIVRYKEHHEATAIFVVDASGSAAAQRLAEAKGAVELLLADSYVRRDRIALIAFRGKKADVLLPPTRSLQRAKRALAALPGGGGTPLGDAIAQARQLADQVRRGGGAPLVVFLTDGRANISRGGAADRSSAMRESAEMARTLRSDGTRAMIIDISASPHEAARALAANMAATYVALPHAGAQAISQYVAHAMPAR